MKLIKLFAASVTVLGALAASPAAFAHATYNVGTGAAPVWANGAPAEWLAPTATVPSIGYIGIHGITNKRVIETGVYNYGYAAATAVNLAGVTTAGPLGATTADLGGAFGGATPVVGDSLLGQLRKYNEVTNTPGSSVGDLPLASISTGANSWAGAVTDTSPGLSWGNIHASTGTGNLEANLMAAGVNYINVTVGDDNLFAGVGQLAFSLYQGWATGPGMSGLNLLGTVLASTAGQDIGLSIMLTGNSLNGIGAAGEYTVVVGDQSAVGGQYRMAVEASATARYGNVVSSVSAVPVPGAVWLFGSALAGFAGLRRRKATIVA